MSPELYLYYTTEYSKCEISNNFLSSWQGLAYPCHSIQIIALPLQILTFFVIWKHTPGTMKVVKGPLLTNHFWCSILDLMFCSLVTPYVYLRFFGFFGVGIFSWIGLSVLPQVVLGVLTTFCTIGSYIYVFETRSSSLQMNRFKISKRRNRYLYHGSILTFNCLILICLLWSPENQEAARLNALKVDPCPTVEFFEHNEIFILSTDPFMLKLITRIVGPGVVFNAVFHILFHVIITIYYLFLTPTKILSEGTRRIQKKFFIAAVSQTTIPMVMFTIPLVALALDQITKSLSQEMVNLVIIAFALHGVAESLAVILVHRSYRRAVLCLLTRKKIENKINFSVKTIT